LILFNTGNQAQTNRAILLLAGLLTAGIFVLDLMTPLGWADGFLYLIPLTLVLFLSSQHHRLVGFAILYSGLVMLGWVLSPDGGTPGQVTYNRTLSIVLFWITALFLRNRERVEAALHLSQEQLEGLVEERTAQFQKVIGVLKSEIAERELAQEALWESQQRFRLLIDHVNDAIFYIDLDGTIQWLSCNAGVLTGQPSDKLIGRPIMALLSSSAATQAEARLAAVRRGDVVPPLAEFEFLRSDGSTVFAEASIASVRRDGKVVGRLIVARDITDRKQAEETMRESRQRMELALNGAELGLWDIHIPTGHVVYSQQWARMLGYTVEEIQPHFSSWENLIHPDDRPQIIALWKAHLAGHTALYQADHRLRAKSGEWKWVQTYGKVLERDPEGKPLRASGIHVDITERKQAEETSRGIEARLAAIVSSSDDAIISKTLDGNILSWNKGAERICGYSAREIVGRPISILFPPDQHDMVPSILERIAQDESIINFETVHLKKDGKQVAVSLSISPIKDETGKIIGACTIAHDISERKRAQEALRESEQHLRRALDERERLSQDLHDNVMQTIYAIGLGLEECLRLAQKGAPLIATKMREAVVDLNALIQDIRSYIIGVEPTVSGGIQLAKELSRLVQTTGRCDTLGFHLKLDSMVLQRLSGEQASHILYIAREAISNSLRHSHGQSGSISLWMLGDTVRFEVRDDGVGFTGDMAGSHGHGLRNIAARVDKLGGLLRITSEPGNGVGIVVDILLEREHVAF
jgi:PAS domain S-box-containing protein